MTRDFTVVDTATPGEWEAWTRENVVLTDEGVELARAAAPTFVAPVRRWTEAFASARPIDIDVTVTGDEYVLTADGRLFRAVCGSDSFRPVRCEDLRSDGKSPTGLCVAGDSLYVVGTRRVAATDDESTDDGVERLRTLGYVHSLSVHSLQTRWVLTGDEWAADDDAPGTTEGFVEPTRVVNGPDETVYVLDRGSDTDRGFVARVSERAEVNHLVRELRAPVDLAVTADGAIAVLVGGDSEAALFGWYPDGSEPDGDAVELPVASATSIEWLGDGAFVLGVGPDAPSEKTLYRYDPETNAADPLTSYKHSCVRLRRGPWGAVDPQLYAIDGAEGVVWVLDPAETVEIVGGAYVGRLTTRYDFGALDADWYRLALELGTQPPGTRVVLRYAATNADAVPGDPEGEGDGVAEGGVDGPSEDGGGGSEDADGMGDADGPVSICEPSDDADDEPDPVWATADSGYPNHVLVEPNGRRYLWVRLELHGDRFHTPRVDRLKLSVTHDSYLDYLPAIYETDEESADFLARYLTVFEDTYADIDHHVATLTEYFDPESVPSSHLSWLGSWLSVAEDDAWSDWSRRELVAQAPNLFRERGTRRGLRRLLDIFLGGIPVESGAESPTGAGEAVGVGRPAEPRVSGGEGDEAGHGHFVWLLEYWDVADVADADSDCDAAEGSCEALRAERASGDDAESPFDAVLCCPQEFVVLVGPTVDADARAAIRRLVEAQQPAHAVGRTVHLRPWSRLGGHVLLGVNSRLPDPSFTVAESNLGWDSVVGTAESDAELGWQSRLGSDFELS